MRVYCRSIIPQARANCKCFLQFCAGLCELFELGRSDGDGVCDLDHVAVDGLVHREGHIDIVVDDLIAGDGDNAVVDALIDQVKAIVLQKTGYTLEREIRVVK